MVKPLLLNHLVYREYHFSPEKPYIIFLHHAANPTVLNMPLSHFHNYVEIGIYRHPKGSVFIEGQTHPLITDGFFLIPPFTSHYTLPAPSRSDDLEIDYFYFDPQLLMECIFPDFLSSAKATYFPRGIPFMYPSREYPLLNRILQCIVNELQSPEQSPASINGLILAFYTELDALKTNRPTYDRPKTAILPALYYLNEHYMEETDCQFLAHLCNLCTGHFRREFKANTNLTISQYVSHLRIEAACGKMLESEDSILDIALSVGFCSYSAFHGTFKALFNTSPRKWRDAQRTIHKNSIRHIPYKE